MRRFGTLATVACGLFLLCGCSGQTRSAKDVSFSERQVRSAFAARHLLHQPGPSRYSGRWSPFDGPHKILLGRGMPIIAVGKQTATHVGQTAPVFVLVFFRTPQAARAALAEPRVKTSFHADREPTLAVGNVVLAAQLPIIASNHDLGIWREARSTLIHLAT